jgi:hypothetical protein
VSDCAASGRAKAKAAAPRIPTKHAAHRYGTADFNWHRLVMVRDHRSKQFRQLTKVEGKLVANPNA